MISCSVRTCACMSTGLRAGGIFASRAIDGCPSAALEMRGDCIGNEVRTLCINGPTGHGLREAPNKDVHRPDRKASVLVEAAKITAFMT